MSFLALEPVVGCGSAPAGAYIARGFGSAMAANRRLSTGARAYVTAVVTVGAAAGAFLVAGIRIDASEIAPILVFAALGILTPLVSISQGSSERSFLSHQISSSFAYPLLVLVDPGVVFLLFAATALADKLLHGRSWLVTAFNAGQFGVSCGARANWASRS